MHVVRRLSRRGFLVGSASTATAASVLGWHPQMWARASDRTSRTIVAPDGTTLASTIVPVGSSGYRTTGEGPGEPFVVRTEMARPAEGREDRRIVIAAFVHLTDQHLIDPPVR